MCGENPHPSIFLLPALPTFRIDLIWYKHGERQLPFLLCFQRRPQRTCLEDDEIERMMGGTECGQRQRRRRCDNKNRSVPNLINRSTRPPGCLIYNIFDSRVNEDVPLKNKVFSKWWWNEPDKLLHFSKTTYRMNLCSAPVFGFRLRFVPSCWWADAKANLSCITVMSCVCLWPTGNIVSFKFHFSLSVKAVCLHGLTQCQSATAALE